MTAEKKTWTLVLLSQWSEDEARTFTRECTEEEALGWAKDCVQEHSSEEGFWATKVVLAEALPDEMLNEWKAEEAVRRSAINGVWQAKQDQQEYKRLKAKLGL